MQAAAAAAEGRLGEVCVRMEELTVALEAAVAAAQQADALKVAFDTFFDVFFVCIFCLALVMCGTLIASTIVYWCR